MYKHSIYMQHMSCPVKVVRKSWLHSRICKVGCGKRKGDVEMRTAFNHQCGVLGNRKVLIRKLRRGGETFNLVHFICSKILPESIPDGLQCVFSNVCGVHPWKLYPCLREGSRCLLLVFVGEQLRAIVFH